MDMSCYSLTYLSHKWHFHVQNLYMTYFNKYDFIRTKVAQNNITGVTAGSHKDTSFPSWCNICFRTTQNTCTKNTCTKKAVAWNSKVSTLHFVTFCHYGFMTHKSDLTFPVALLTLNPVSKSKKLSMMPL